VTVKEIADDHDWQYSGLLLVKGDTME